MSAPFFLTSEVPKRARVRRGGWSWGPVEGAKLRVLSLGDGVQSTTLALMAAHSEVGAPDSRPWPDAVPEGDPKIVDTDLWDRLPPAWRALAEVDLSTAEERGQGMLNICDAGCGL